MKIQRIFLILFTMLFVGLYTLQAWSDEGYPHKGQESLSYPQEHLSPMDMNEGDVHQMMEKMMQGCGTLGQGLKEMFEQMRMIEEMEDSLQKKAEAQKHQEKVRQLLHEMTAHMEAGVKMLEEIKAEGLWHDRHHQP